MELVPGDRAPALASAAAGVREEQVRVQGRAKGKARGRARGWAGEAEDARREPKVPDRGGDRPAGGGVKFSLN